MISHWTSVCLSAHLSLSHMSVHPPIRISFPGINELTSMDFHQCGMCLDIVEIWFGIANGQISSNFDGVNISSRDILVS